MKKAGRSEKKREIVALKQQDQVMSSSGQEKDTPDQSRNINQDKDANQDRGAVDRPSPDQVKRSEISDQGGLVDVANNSEAADQTDQASLEESNKGEGAETSSSDADPLVTPARKRKRKVRVVSEEEIMPRPSYWPLALALSLVILLLGEILHPIFLAIGAVLVLAVIIAWGLERR